VTDVCEHGSELSYSVEGREFFDLPFNYLLVTKAKGVFFVFRRVNSASVSHAQGCGSILRRFKHENLS